MRASCQRCYVERKYLLSVMTAKSVLALRSCRLRTSRVYDRISLASFPSGRKLSQELRSTILLGSCFRQNLSCSRSIFDVSSPSYGSRCSSIIKTWCRFAFQSPVNGSIRRLSIFTLKTDNVGESRRSIRARPRSLSKKLPVSLKELWRLKVRRDQLVSYRLSVPIRPCTFRNF